MAGAGQFAGPCLSRLSPEAPTWAPPCAGPRWPCRLTVAALADTTVAKMGCGASVFGPRNSQASNDLGRQPLLEAAPSAANTRGLVTPQRNTRQTNSHSLQLSGAPTHKKAAKGLRIDTAVASRESSGMAVTPMGKVRRSRFLSAPVFILSHTTHSLAPHNRPPTSSNTIARSA